MASIIKELFVYLNNKINTKFADVNDRIDNLDVVTTPFTITLSSSKTSAEYGETINSFKLTWSYSKDILSQKINDSLIDNTLRTITLEGPYTTDTTFKLDVVDKNNESHSKSVKLSFYNGIYYGTSSSISYDSSLISSLTKILSNNIARNITVNAADGEYIYYCIPTRLGTPTFIIGGFEGGLEKVNTISYENGYGYTEDYDIYRSDISGLGNTTITVK